MTVFICLFVCLLVVFSIIATIAPVRYFAGAAAAHGSFGPVAQSLTPISTVTLKDVHLLKAVTDILKDKMKQSQRHFMESAHTLSPKLNYQSNLHCSFLQGLSKWNLI